MNYPAPDRISTSLALPSSPRVMYVPENSKVKFQLRRRHESYDPFQLQSRQELLMWLPFDGVMPVEDKEEIPTGKIKSWIWTALICLVVIAIAPMIFKMFRRKGLFR